MAKNSISKVLEASKRARICLLIVKIMSTKTF